MITQIQEKLHAVVDNGDSRLLKMLYAVAKEYTEENYTLPGKPMTEKDLKTHHSSCYFLHLLHCGTVIYFLHSEELWCRSFFDHHVDENPLFYLTIVLCIFPSDKRVRLPRHRYSVRSDILPHTPQDRR